MGGMNPVGATILWQEGPKAPITGSELRSEIGESVKRIMQPPR